MSRIVAKYVKSCLHCGFAKGYYGRREGLLHPIQRTPVPFDNVHIDHPGSLIRSIRKNLYMLVLVDGFTKFVITKPNRTPQAMEMVAKLREIFGEYGYSRRSISNRGLAFTRREFGEFVTTSKRSSRECE